MTNVRFANKVAVVTGAGRGMGREIALTLAREGAAVVVNDVQRPWAESVAAEITAAHGRALAFVADVSDPVQVEALMQAAVEHFGSVDILVNNAGMLGHTQ